MKCDRQRAPASFTETRRQRLNALGAVDREIHQRVHDVEAGDPDGDGGEEQQCRPTDATGDADVGAQRRESVDRAEHEMRDPRDAFAKRIEQHAQAGDRKQFYAERIEHPCRPQQDGEACDDRREHRKGRERAAGERAPGGARIARVDVAVEVAIGGHRRGACAQHRQRDPAKHGPRWKAAGGDQRADVRERQREERMLDANLPQEERGFHRGSPSECSSRASAAGP